MGPALLKALRRGVAALAAALGAALVIQAGPATAGPPSVEESIPDLGAAPSLGDLAGRPITRIEIVTLGGRWQRPLTLRRVRLGDPLSGELARRAMRELTDSGFYAEVRAEAVPEPGGVVLRLRALPRRIAQAVRISGGVLDGEETLRAAGLDAGDEVTVPLLREAAERTRAFYVAHGFPRAAVTPDAIDTDNEMRVTVTLYVVPGAPRVVATRSFTTRPAPTEELDDLLRSYSVSPGDRADDEMLTAADRDLEEALKRAGWYAASVAHRAGGGDRVALVVDVKAGPFVRVRFDGNRHFDSGDLLDHLELDTADDRSPATLASQVEKFYVERGFLDVHVTPELRGSPTDVVNDVVLHVRENDLVRVVAREYPCLTGPRSADDVGAEIDSFLSEALPGTGFVGPVDPRAVDQALGPRGTTGARIAPLQANPWKTYVAEVYERATKHLTELYRSEGFLSASVGPVVVMRRACDPRSPAGQCIPVGDRVRPPVRCPKTETELPVEDTVPPESCVPDARTGKRCETEVVLHIPIKLGPRAILWDAVFDGNRILTERELADIAELPLGDPVSQIELEKARRRLIDEYAERGFAFATVELRLEFSPDRTRARARFVVNEREPVRVKDIIVRGARNTNESLILGRVALEKGDLYRRSDVRKTEERLATLGVFSSVQVALEDPEVFAKEKVVVITVRERPQQYLDVRPGFSTGDGFRITFEYGHRNLGGEAIRLTLRVQLGLLPDFLIFEPEVRARFQALPLTLRLERRDTASIEFPEIGLGPLFPLGIDGIDVRDNARDFGLTKEAGIVTLSYRPTTRFITQVGGSLELNDARIFAQGQDLVDYLQRNPSLRVPDGKTYAIAERTNVTWDRRDDPFNATRGTFVSAGVEHVHAAPADTSATITSDFLRITNRIGGYVRLTDRGLSLALSFRWGYNVQLIQGSQTYPDRLFFFGGVDSIRGFIQDSVIPEDLAQRILSDSKLIGQRGVDQAGLLTPDLVAIRGGNLMLNPRAELRIPLGGAFQTALFLDSGNLWLDPTTVNPTHLRYAAGTGLRATTPVGPLALDIGFNLDRREWEDPFAFHFSIGLF